MGEIMQRSVTVLGMVALVIGLGAGAAMAADNPVSRACQDARPDAGELCSCIGTAAELVLDQSAQRRAAQFFTNPDRAEAVRMSDNRNDEALWEAYQQFGETAVEMCG